MERGNTRRDIQQLVAELVFAYLERLKNAKVCISAGLKSGFDTFNT